MICGVWDGWKVFNSLMQLFLSSLISRSFTFGQTQFEACTQQIMSAFLECDSSTQQNCSDLLLHSGVSQFLTFSPSPKLWWTRAAHDRVAPLCKGKENNFNGFKLPRSVKMKRETKPSRCLSCWWVHIPANLDLQFICKIIKPFFL